MPSVLPHLVAPILLAMAFMPMHRKRILRWSPIAVAPDVDYFLWRSFHRAAFHNIWLPLLLAGALVLLWRLRDRTADFWEWAWRPGAPGNLLLANYFLISHILMDFFVGGVSLIWPIRPRNFFFIFEIVVDTSTNQPVITGEGGTDPDIVTVSPSYEWWSVIDTAVAAFVLAALVAMFLYRRRRLARDPPPVVVRRTAVMGPSHKE